MRYFNKDSLNYEFKAKLEAGLVLSGSDVKSLRTQGVQFKGAKVEVVNSIPTIFNLHISPYKFAQNIAIDTTTERKLLLTQKEIAKLLSFRNQKYMIIPIAFFTKGRWFKVDLGIGRKLRKFEKREKIKKEEMKKNGF